jgi:hypothetical protein
MDTAYSEEILLRDIHPAYPPVERSDWQVAMLCGSVVFWVGGAVVGIWAALRSFGW